jgi:catechol 2,3-dioxygenase-like lactoylglutathione lyase family enzyme
MSENKEQGALPFLSNGVSQVALVVPDLEAAVKGYWSLFGIGPWHFYTYDKKILHRLTYRGRPADYRMRIALASAGPQRIELIQMLEGETIYAEFVRRHGYGLHHLGILVEDMEAAVRQAEAAGLQVTMDGAGFGLDGDGYYAYLDTEELVGTTIELIQRPRRRRPPEKIYPPE